MHIHKSLILMTLSLALAWPAAPPPAGEIRAAAAPQGAALAAGAEMPLHFIANRGQRDETIAYHARGSGYSFAFTAEGVTIVLDGALLQARFVDAAPIRPTGAEKTRATVNYLVGDDPARWRTDIPTYDALLYENLYPGIDLRYEGEAGALKYTLVAEPGADVSQFRMDYGESARLRLDETGDLLISVEGGELRDTRPYAYQESGGRRAPVDVVFVLRDAHTVGFAVRGEYDPRRPLVIDPSLEYASYLGGGGDDRGYGVAIDTNGYVYITGETKSSDFPAQNPAQGDQPYADVFIAKLDLSQSGAASLVYATYLGGESEDTGQGIAVDGDGNACVTGYTYSTDFPTTPNAYQPTPYGDFPISGFERVFVAKLNAAGNALLYSTYLRGSGGVEGEWITMEKGRDIAVDGAGLVYVTGETLSPDFPTTANAFQKTKAGDSSTWDAFFTKLDTAQSGAASLLYSTYFGGSQTERGLGIAVDGAGGAYVVGQTYASPDLPTRNPYQAAPGGGWDGFVARLDAAGALLYSTYLGGDEMDWAWDVAANGAGHAGVIGETESTDFPTKNPYQAANNGGLDAFIAKIDTAQSGDDSLIYATYLGGEGNECTYSGCAIAVGGDGCVYAAGSTDSSYFPTQYPYRDDSLWDDAFVTQLNAAGSALIYSTYLGGNGSDGVTDIGLDGAGNAYVVGMTTSTQFFDMQRPYQASNAGRADAFIVALGPNVPDLSTSHKRVGPAVIEPAGTLLMSALRYTITLNNTGALTAAVSITDTLPPEVALVGGPVCPSGTCGYHAGGHVITWSGSLAPSASTWITYTGLVSAVIEAGASLFIVNTARVDDGVHAPLTLRASVAVNPRTIYLPLVLKSYP